MRLARSGPNIQISINDGSAPQGVSVSRTEAPNLAFSAAPEVEKMQQPLAAADSAALLQPESPSEEPEPIAPPSLSSLQSPFYVSGRYPIFGETHSKPFSPPQHLCDHQGAPEGSLICTDCGFPIHPLQDIGAYQVLKPLNASGNILMAWRSGHTVVLNTLKPSDQQAEHLVSEFESQAQLLCHLEHPGMPKFFEAFESKGQPYLVSEMIHGPNLRDWIAQRGPMSSYQAIQCALELSRLLDFLHTQTPPYIHRHIQPSNLIRPRIPQGFSQAVLVGFGEIKGISSESGTLSGAGSYYSPEQHMNEDMALSDLYALGATLLYLLTGQEPDAFYRLGDNDYRLQVQDIPNVRPEVAHIIEKLTHPQTHQRYESAVAVAEALQLLL
jgi:serine/threonine-protein kinase